MERITDALLSWFDENRRALPFRDAPTPYRVWISEIMLQQTRMTAVLPYYERFIAALPDVAALAACDTERLHKLWEGLGYYSRADNLRRAAVCIMEKHGGTLPSRADELTELPGIGPYTAGAIASIAYGQAALAVDGNVLRVFARLYNDRADITAAPTKKRFTERVWEHLSHERPGDFNQALMELGALVCVPGEPRCEACPLHDRCEAYRAGTASYLPMKAEKKPRRIEARTVLVLQAEGCVLLRRRPARGLLAGLWEPINLAGVEDARAWVSENLPDASLIRVEPLPASRHIFSHIEWHMEAYLLTLGEKTKAPGNTVWVSPGELERYAIPNAFSAYRGVISGSSQ